MASAGTEQYSTGFKREIQQRLGPAPPSPLERHQETRTRRLVPQPQVKPVWRLERRCASAIKDRNSGQRGVVTQQTYYCFPDHVSTTGTFSPPLLRTVPSESLHTTHLPRDPLASPSLFQQSTHGHKPYQKLESLCLRPEVNRRRVFISPSRNSIASSSANTFTTPVSAMSSFVNQFHLPSAAGEPPAIGTRASSSRATSLYKPALNTNSFLRPNSAKVPSYLSQESRKVKNPRMSAGSASWKHPVCHGDDTASPKSNSVAFEPNRVAASTSLHGGSNQMGQRTPSKLDDGGSGKGSLKSGDKAVRLTEAVRKLTQNGFVKNPQTGDCRLVIDASTSSQFHNEAQSSNCKRKAQTVLNPTPMEEADPAASEFDRLCPKGDLSHTSMESANVCPKRISVDLLISSPDTPEHISRTVSGLSDHSEDQETTVEDGRLMNVTAVATQISTIQLDKKNGLPDETLWEMNAEAGDHVTCRELLRPDQSKVDDTEEELANGLEDGCSLPGEEEDDDDLDTSVAGISSASVLLISRHCMDESTTEAMDKIQKPAFTQSIFPNVPPTLYFGTCNETVELLPWEQRKFLKWRMSTVTPNVVKQAIARSHFRTTKKNHDWLGCWGHHMKSPAFKTILEYQKLNHFPGSFQIGRKDRLWRNLSKMQARFGRKEFNFFPQSFVLPLDIKLLKKTWEESGTRQKWIVKPPASARGIGIQVIHKWSQLPKRRPLLVQRYLHKPYLIGGSKFDLRIYVYVPSYDPLRVYLFTDGLVRFASCKYSPSMKSLSNKFMHLTNYSVNKKNSEYKSNSDEKACQGHKWALKALWSYLNEKGVNSDKIWEKIKDIVVKTIIASEPYVNSLTKMYLRRPYCCHELFGFDIMLDENLKPWILEVNISPSLHSNSPLDVNIKGQMIRDLLNLAGFVLPNLEDVILESASASSSNTSLTSNGREKSKLTPELFTEEKMKRAYYLSQKLPDEDFYPSVLDMLTPDDVRALVEMEDEHSRRGHFERVFPSSVSGRYLRFFEQPRYLNILLNQWEQKYRDHKEKGLELLKNFCQRGFHTRTVPDATPVWSTPRSFSRSDAHINGFSKPDPVRLCKTSSPKDKSTIEDLLKTLTPTRSPQNVSRYPGTIETTLPTPLSNLSDIALVM